MANTFPTVCQTVLVFLFLFAAVKCSEVEFTSNEASKTDELTMRCSLKKTTPQELNEIKGIIITKPYGENLAVIKTDKPATLVDNTTEGVQVTGHLQQSGQEIGFLQVVWKHPVSAWNGKYNCFIYANGENFHIQKLVKSVTVQIEKVKYDDLVESVRQLKLVNDKQEESVRQLQLINDKQEQSVRQLKLVIDKQKKSRVMFTAYLSQHKKFKDGKDIVFDKVLTNIGGGYNKSSGVFTCPVDGYYVFQLHITSQHKHNARGGIKVNGEIVGSAFSLGWDGGQWLASSTSATVVLKAGDTVHVTSSSDSFLNGFSTSKVSSFSGYLLALK